MFPRAPSLVFLSAALNSQSAHVAVGTLDSRVELNRGAARPAPPAGHRPAPSVRSRCGRNGLLELLARKERHGFSIASPALLRERPPRDERERVSRRVRVQRNMHKRVDGSLPRHPVRTTSPLCHSERRPPKSKNPGSFSLDCHPKRALRESKDLRAAIFLLPVILSVGVCL